MQVSLVDFFFDFGTSNITGTIEDVLMVHLKR